MIGSRGGYLQETRGYRASLRRLRGIIHSIPRITCRRMTRSSPKTPVWLHFQRLDGRQGGLKLKVQRGHCSNWPSFRSRCYRARLDPVGPFQDQQVDCERSSSQYNGGTRTTHLQEIADKLSRQTSELWMFRIGLELGTVPNWASELRAELSTVPRSSLPARLQHVDRGQ